MGTVLEFILRSEGKREMGTVLQFILELLAGSESKRK